MKNTSLVNFSTVMYKDPSSYSDMHTHAGVKSTCKGGKAKRKNEVREKERKGTRMISKWWERELGSQLLCTLDVISESGQPRKELAVYMYMNTHVKQG